jgi:hypothetical protein
MAKGGIDRETRRPQLNKDRMMRYNAKECQTAEKIEPK